MHHQFLVHSMRHTPATCITRNVLIRIAHLYSMTEPKLHSGKTRYNEKVHRNIKQVTENELLFELLFKMKWIIYGWGNRIVFWGFAEHFWFCL